MRRRAPHGRSLCGALVPPPRMRVRRAGRASGRRGQRAPRVNRGKPTALGCLGALLLSCVTGLFGLYQWDYRTSLTAEAPAEVLRIANRGSRADQNRHTVIDYRYTVDGRTYEARFTKRGPNQRPGASRPDFEVGQPAKVCYNPTRPHVSEIFRPTYKCPDPRLPKFLRGAGRPGR